MKAEEISKWVHDKVLEKWGDGGGTYARPLNYLKPVLVSVKWAEYIFGVVTAYVSSNTGGGDGLSVWWPEISCVTQSVTACDPRAAQTQEHEVEGRVKARRLITDNAGSFDH